MPFIPKTEYLKRAVNALETELDVMNMKPIDQIAEYLFEKRVEREKEKAGRYLLGIRTNRKDSSGYFVGDQDRVIVNEALKANIDIKYIDLLLLQDYPRACESGGIVDHVDHPIHNACRYYRRAVPIILKHSPECAKQRDEEGKLPLQIYLENGDLIDVTSEEFASTVNLLEELHPLSTEEPFMKDKNLKNDVIKNSLAPFHVQCTCAVKLKPENSSQHSGEGYE